MINAPFNWNEVVPAGSVQRTSISGGTDSLRATLTFRVAWNDVKTALTYILGYSKVLGTANNWRLSRQPPARHPWITWLKCTQLLSVYGRGGQKNGTWKGIKTVGNGWYGSWNDAEITVLFEAPKYRILSDSEYNGYEYQRWTEKIYETNVENLARRGEQWQFISNIARLVTKAFPGDLLVKQPKGKLVWTWYDVHEDWVMLGKLIPSNLINASGKVNQYAFPTAAEPDQNLPGPPATYVQFPPGTLLMEPARMQSRSQINPDLATNLNPDALRAIFPRTYNIGLSMIHFDPSNDETATVKLAKDGGGTVNVDIIGHNLVPLPAPSSSGKRWYAAASGAGGLTNPVPSDAYLLYQYYDFEKVFSFARSPFGTNQV